MHSHKILNFLLKTLPLFLLVIPLIKIIISCNPTLVIKSRSLVKVCKLNKSGKNEDVRMHS